MSENQSYIVLARKYRPKRLSDVVGQNEISAVLEGAIKLNRVAHAFLFSGIRGVGKTTLARILAKILNCTEINNELIEACGKCSNCVSIENESNMDVVEIDAASKTGVADVREIIENVNYKPLNGKKKIFIIDEVHMLSKAAFNALLKTLEEPPPDVVFIFATTETEKVPVTILSRCQRFFLRRVSFNLISEHLKKIANLEGLKLDDESSNLIAQCSEGSVRDALSILENVIAKSESLSPNVVRKVLGLTDSSFIIQLFENLLIGDVENSLSQFDKLYEDGISIDELAKSLMTLSHKLALIKSGVQKNIQNLNPELIQKLQTLSENYEMDFIIRFWELNQKFLNELSDVFDEKQCFEMVIMRLCYASLLPTPFEIINKIEKKNNNKDISRISAVNENIQPKDKNESISNFGNNVLIQDNLARKKIEKNLEKNDGDSQEVKLKKFSELIRSNGRLLSKKFF